ncbi:MAG: hydrogen peroxide-inducible genes activator [Ancalomicrobiaceae bacterium]|nr:hydrogen peroxide-inducible genes activator [Ancalomicrobiaceae bacterium]
MRSLPTLRQLRFLVAVVDRCHFGRAAEFCLVSQSTLSAAIQELEDVLGVPLIERTRRSVVPTLVGLEVAERARAVLRDAEDLVDVAMAVHDPMSGPLHLGVIPTVGPFVLPRLLPSLWQAFPDLKIYLREEQSAPLLARLGNGQLDAVLIALPFQTDDLDLSVVASDRFSLVVPKGHRLGRQTAVAGKDLAHEDVLFLEDGHCMREHALAACSFDGGRRDSAFAGTSLLTLVQMVASGLGITLVPQTAIESGLLQALDVTIVPFVEEAPARKIALGWRKASSRKETFRLLAAKLEECLAR